MKKIKAIAIILAGISALSVSSCGYSDVKMSTTLLPAEYNDGYVYLYKESRGSDTESEFSLIRYDIETAEEKEIISTDAVKGIHVYDDYIYYFDKNDHNLYAVNEDTLKPELVYEIKDSMPQNDYIKSGSTLLYLDADTLIVRIGDDESAIDNVRNFNIDKNQIYYSEVNGKNDWNIVKIQADDFTKKEVILTLDEIKALYDDAFKEEGKIDDISVCGDKLYFTVSEYSSNRRNLFCYDLNTKELDKFTEQYIIEYRAAENAVYCLGEDRVLKRYDDSTEQILLENVYSFKAADNDILMYMNLHDDTLYIKSDEGDTAIPNVLSAQ
ncbi:MAG: DUF5050 domain-containing protein [Firmicutes bacterium]|nr:DUF5050 domain-containing protein [Bacillota bacterium]